MRTNVIRGIVALFVALGLVAAVLPSAHAAQELTGYVTAQRFEHGLMIWRADTGFVWALTDDGRAYGYPANYYRHLPDNPYFPTESGQIRPINGFGRVWGNVAFLRQQLGWAVLPELGFQSRLAVTGGIHYITQLDGKVIEIQPNGAWRYVDAIPSPPYIPVAINHFNVTPRTIQPGDSVKVEWSVQGTDMALIEVRDPRVGDAYLVELLEDLPPNGTTLIAIPDTLTEGATITLWAANRVTTTSGVVMYERLANRTITVQTQVDPGSTIYTRAAFQQYQNGFMIWRADDGSVTVFGGTDGGPRTLFPEYRYGPLRDNPFFDVPPGLTRPISGFGRVWGNFEEVRRMLGWATGPEQAYTLTIQTDRYGKIRTVTLPDGRLVEYHGQWWR